MTYILKTLFLLAMVSFGVFAQSLDDYVSLGLESNLALKQKHYNYLLAKEKISDAKGMYLPSVDINARYTETSGSVLDLGKLINPVYSTLNTMLGSSVFPASLDLKLPLKQETTIRLSQPLFQPGIYYNDRITQSQAEMANYTRLTYARDLVMEIKTAYYNYKKATEAVSLYSSVEELLKENLRLNNSLFTNGKVTKDKVYRSEAELSELQQQLLGATNQKTSAARYFNFLLNREQDAEINVSVTNTESFQNPKSVAQIDNREEVRQLREAKTIVNDLGSLSRSSFLPTLSLAIDYGFQGNSYKFNQDEDYAAVSLVASWNLFNGFRDQSKIEQAEIQIKQLESAEKELSGALRMKVANALDNFNHYVKRYDASKEQERAASAGYEIVEKKYREGNAALIEYIDARTTLTSASISKILAKYDVFIAQAQLERETAGYEFTIDFLKK